MTEPKPELVLRWADGELNLLGWNDGLNDVEFHIEALTGTAWGNPQPVRRALRRFLLDGSTSVKDYDDNREITLELRVSAPDGFALAAAEIPLAQADGRRCELVWTPPDSSAAPAVFVATSIDLRHNMDDEAESDRERYYTLTLSCLPHAYSDEWVTIPAVAQGSSTPVTLNDCSSLTGWTASNATLALAGSTIVVTAATVATDFSVTLTSAVDLTTDTYLALVASLRAGGSLVSVEAQASAGSWQTLAQAGSDAGAYVFSAVGIADPTVTAVRFNLRKPLGGLLNNNGGQWATFDTVRKQSSPRSAASRQQVRTLTVPGSRRTPTHLLIESPTTGLGTVLFYTGPAYDPSLSRGHEGARTAASTRISGSYDDTPTSSIQSYKIKASEFTRGDHSIWIRSAPKASGTTGTLTLTVALLVGGVAVYSHTIAAAALSWGSTAYELDLIGSTDLPHWPLPDGSDAILWFTAQWVATPGLPVGPDRGILIDELFAFNRTEGALTIVEAGTNRRVWLDAPSLDRDTPSAFVGTGDKAGAVPVSLTTSLPVWPGSHIISSPVTHAYTASTDAADVQVSGLLRAAHHTHPTS